MENTDNTEIETTIQNKKGELRQILSANKAYAGLVSDLDIEKRTKHQVVDRFLRTRTEGKKSTIKYLFWL